MVVLITCKSDENSIKNKITVVRTFSEKNGTQGRVTLMPVVKNRTYRRSYACPCYLQVWWRSNQKWSLYQPDISQLYVYGSLKGQITHANCLIWSKIKLFQCFMPIFIISKCDEDPIKNKVTIARTAFSPLYVYRTFWVPWKPKTLTRSAPKPNTANPPPQWWYPWILIKTG